MRRRRKSWQARLTVGQVVIYLVLGLVFIVEAYPFFYTLSLAVMPYGEYMKRPIHALPSGFTTLYFEQLFRDTRIARSYLVSILRTAVGTTLNVLATTMAGFALSRRGTRLGRFLNLLFLIPMFVNPGLIPYYLLIRATGLLNSFWVMILPGLVSSFYLFMVRAYFIDYPQEVIEAAIVDGAHKFGVFWRIVWPTSTPMVATLALLYGTAHWNEYFWSSILVPPRLHPATVILQSLASERIFRLQLGLDTTPVVPESFIAAVASALIVPVVIAYPFLQRYVVKGLMIGAIKG